MIFTGHNVCCSIGGEHKIHKHNGAAAYSLGTCVVASHDENEINEELQIFTIIHELGHLFGANDHYGHGKKTTEDMNTLYNTDDFNMHCIYGEDSYDDDPYVDDVDFSSLQEYLCEGCNQKIAEERVLIGN